MSEYVRVLKTDAVAIREATQTKAGGSGTMTASEVAEAISGISGSEAGNHIYGVMWGNEVEDDLDCIEQMGTRTDEAASFSNPVPFVYGASEQAAIVNAAACTSPFDDLYPWNRMKIVKMLAGDFVSIPKFWYKWTKASDDDLASFMEAVEALDADELKSWFAEADDEGSAVTETMEIDGEEYEATVEATSDTSGYITATISGMKYKLDVSVETDEETGDDTIMLADKQCDFGMKLQIATYAAQGFSLAPAFRARTENDTDKDVVYIARYHCGGSTGQATTRLTPLTNITRANLRTAFSTQMSALNADGYTIQDYAMFWTLRMLYLVEYANWNGQAAIGYGCGDGEAAASNGTTDQMPYHTGTMAASLTTYGQGVQYRYVEDPWCGVAEWIDGWYTTSIEEEDGEGSTTTRRHQNIIMDPASFSDTTGGVDTGALPDSGGCICGWTIPDTEGYDWALIPRLDGTADDEDFAAGVADVCGFYGPALLSGGAWDPYPGYGPFCLGSDDASVRDAVVGARLQKIP